VAAGPRSAACRSGAASRSREPRRGEVGVGRWRGRHRMSSAEMEHAMAPWNASALDCSEGGLALCLDAMENSMAPAACVSFKDTPGFFPAGTYCVCEMFRFGPACDQIDTAGLFQAGWYMLLAAMSFPMVLRVRQARQLVWRYILKQPDASQGLSTLRSLLFLQLGFASMCAWSFTYVLILVIPNPPLGFRTLRAISKCAAGMLTGFISGGSFVAVSVSYQVIERERAQDTPENSAGRVPLSVVILRTSTLFTLTVTACLSLTATMNLVIAENAVMLLALAGTVIFYVDAQGKIITLIKRYAEQEQSGHGHNKPFQLALQRSARVYRQASRSFVSFGCLVVFQLAVGRGIKVRLGDSSGVFGFCRVAASVAPLCPFYFAMSLVRFLDGAAREASKVRALPVSRPGQVQPTRSLAHGSSSVTTKIAHSSGDNEAPRSYIV
jgi:hypothetical protein